ncbi:MAG TPA: PHP domain-containing protein [Bacillota bacterium]|nr:PHP domain-containing protein [Bacillota bacterium]HPT86773.1 PHP domain-containing protein [Bacillota bacterium]
MWRAFADYHTHTKYSRVGGTIKENALKAKEAGLEEVGIADHGPANWGHWGCTSLEDFDQIIAETRLVEAELDGIKVLAGVEANIVGYDGSLDIPGEIQRKLDKVLAGFHVTVKPRSLEEGVRFMTGRLLAPVSDRIYRKVRNENTKAIVEAVYNNKIDVITHPGLKISIDTYELAKACVKRGTALEINSKHGIESVEFVKAAAREGACFVIGSDAHSPDRVGDLEPGLRAAKLAGLTVDQLLNVREE